MGERRIGKSSLLYHLMLTGAERLPVVGDERYRFVYFSLQDAHFQTLAGFCATVLRKLGLNDAAVADGQSAAAKLPMLEDFTDELETLTAAGERVVLCLGEFETTFKQRDEFGMASLSICARNSNSASLPASPPRGIRCNNCGSTAS